MYYFCFNKFVGCTSRGEHACCSIQHIWCYATHGCHSQRWRSDHSHNSALLVCLCPDSSTSTDGASVLVWDSGKNLIVPEIVNLHWYSHLIFFKEFTLIGHAHHQHQNIIQASVCVCVFLKWRSFRIIFADILSSQIFMCVCLPLKWRSFHIIFFADILSSQIYVCLSLSFPKMKELSYYLLRRYIIFTNIYVYMCVWRR